MLNYIVILNWAGTWDHIFHNAVLYRRETDQKWTFHPWDADGLYTSRSPQEGDVYAGDTSQPHLLRRAIIRNFKEELKQRYRLFQATIHSKNTMTSTINWANALYDRNQAAEGFGKVTQNLTACVSSMRSYSNVRWDLITQRFGTYSGDANAEFARVTCPSKPDIVTQFLNYSALPGAPIDFQVIRRSSTSVEVRWFPPNTFGNTIVAYIVRSGLVGEPLRNHPTRATISVNQPSHQHFGPQGFVDENLAPGAYRYTVAAVFQGATAANFAPITTVNLVADNNNNNNNNGLGIASAAIIGNEQNYGATPVPQTSARLNTGAAAAIISCAIVFVVATIIGIITLVPKLLKKNHLVEETV